MHFIRCLQAAIFAIVALEPNPSINTDWRDKAAPAGYVKRWASQK